MPGPLGCGPLRRCFFTQILGNHGDRGSDHHRSGTGGTTTSNRSPRALVFDSEAFQMQNRQKPVLMTVA